MGPLGPQRGAAVIPGGRAMIARQLLRGGLRVAALTWVGGILVIPDLPDIRGDRPTLVWATIAVLVLCPCTAASSWLYVKRSEMSIGLRIQADYGLAEQ